MNQAKKCKKGFPCGKTCISKLRKCWANLSTDKQRVVETYNQFVNRIVGTGNGMESSIPNNQPVAVQQQQPEVVEQTQPQEPENLDEKIKQQPKVEIKDLFTESFKEELYDKYAQIGEDDKLMYHTYQKGKYVTYILEHGVHQEKQLEFILGAFKSKVVNPRFFTRYKKDIDKIVDFKKADKTFPVNEENLRKIIFEPTIEVSWDSDYPDDATDKDKLKVALEARKMWKESILPSFQEGQVLFNTPLGGFNGARAKAYMKQGFSPVDCMGYQYAIMENGKLVPFEVFPEAEYYKKDSITSEEFKKQTNYN